MRKLLIIAITQLLTLNLYASERPYGTAGCGLGSIIIGKKDAQIVAATTNALSTQSFSITSGTSNCYLEPEAKTSRKNFIEANMESIITQSAKGEGDTIKTLASLYNCQQSGFAKLLQSNYSSISATQDSTTMMNQIDELMNSYHTTYCGSAI